MLSCLVRKIPLLKNIYASLIFQEDVVKWEIQYQANTFPIHQKLINNMKIIKNMKKIKLIILAVLFSIIGYGQGDFNVPVNYGSRIASEFQARVIDSGGTYYPNIAAHQIDQTHSYGLVPIFRMIPAAAGASVYSLSHL